MRTCLLALISAETVLAFLELSVDRFPDLVKESCVVLVSKESNKELIETVRRIDYSVLAPNGIPVVLADWGKLSAEKNVKFNLEGHRNNRELVVLERKLPDRACLLKVGLLSTELRGFVFSGNKSVGNILDFVNNGCNSFWSQNGSLNSQGLHRKRILENLFSVKNTPNVISMRELVKECRNLRHYFRAGTCESATEYCTRRENCGTPNLSKCQVVDWLPDENEFFSEFLSQGKPVIFKNALGSWPAFSSWSTELFRHRFGEKEIHIKLTPPAGEFEGVEPRDWWNASKLEVPREVTEQLKFPDLVMVRPEGVNMKMREFLDLIERRSPESGKSSAYLEYTPLQEYMKDLENDTIEFRFVKNLLELSLQNIWLSDGNTLGKLHFDQYDNLLCQLRGKKQVIMFEPWKNENLYEGHIPEGMLRYKNGEFFRDKLLESTALTMSPVDMTFPDFQKFPLFADTFPLNCTIEEGDVLYLPAFWWHEVQSYPNEKEQRNLAVNYWYEPFLWKEFPCPDCRIDVNPKYRHLL